MAAKRKKKKKTSPSSSPASGGFSGLSHLLLILLTLLGIYLLLAGISGYRNLRDHFVRNNLKFILQNPGLSYEEKMRIKFPRDYPYVMFVKKNTPDSAVIVMPPRSVKSVFKKTHGAQNKIWDEYFLYPRKLLYADETENPLMQEVTHVMIINNWGYDFLEEKYGLNYPRKAAYTILPVRRGTNQ